MKGFTRISLKVERLDGKKVRLLEPLSYVLGDKFCIKVPQGYTTDYASIPKWLQWLYSPTEDGVWKSAIVHDFLYDSKPFSRRFSDSIFLKAMREEGARKGKRNIIWLSVRLFGGSRY